MARVCPCTPYGCHAPPSAWTPPTDPAYCDTVNLYRQWIQSVPTNKVRWLHATVSARDSTAAYTARASQVEDYDFAVKAAISAASDTGLKEEQNQALRRQYQALYALSRPIQASVPVDL